MPFSNMGSTHISAEHVTAINTALETIVSTLSPYFVNLSPEERQRFGSIHETNKLFVNKVWDYRTSQPALSSSDVDWKEFEDDMKDRRFAEQTIARLSDLITQLESIKILHDYDNYRNALTDYDYTKYKMGTSATGFTQKHEDLRQFFPAGGNPRKPEDETPQ